MFINLNFIRCPIPGIGMNTKNFRATRKLIFDFENINVYFVSSIVQSRLS